MASSKKILDTSELRSRTTAKPEDRKGIDFATVDEFAQDESCLDGFPDSNVIGDEKTRHLETQRHEERDELIDARLERKLGGGTERAGTATER